MSSLPEISRIASWADSPTIAVVLVLLFALMVVAKNFMGAFQLEKVRLFFRNKERVTYADSDADSTLAATLLLFACAVVSFSLFLSLVYCRIEGQTYIAAQILWLPLLMAGLLLLWIFVQWALLKLTGYCANKDAEIPRFIRTFFVVFIVVGLLLFPIVLGLIYAPQMLFDALMYVGFAVVAVGLIFLFYLYFHFFLFFLYFQYYLYV